MSKSKKTKPAAAFAAPASTVAKLGAEDASVDPTLASLFASSFGPVRVVVKQKQSAKTASVPIQPSKERGLPSSRVDSRDDGDDNSGDGGDDSDEDDPESSDASSEADPLASASKPDVTTEKLRKRKRATDEDDLEQAYFKRLQREENKENKQNQVHQDDIEEATSSEGDAESEDDSASEPSEIEVPLRHEVLDKKLNDQDKINRTVFLGNVSTDAIRIKSAKRALARHLRSVLKTPTRGKRLGKLESIRFRSTAYAAKSGPKKATFAKKELMDTTTTSTNAYAVFTTDVAAQHVANKLNGSVVLDRHLRVDYLAKPLPVEHKRCVFIGNLSFVNEETPQAPEDNEQQRRPTAKQPADAEEGLWRTFGKCGHVESVRVVRDQETRVSKGFAYVQFQDENSVEAALLMNEKKFPPMLPRKLRVMRARKMKVKPASLPMRGGPRAGPKPSKSSLVRGRTGKPIVFEGHRASEGTSRKGKPQSLKDRKKERNKKRPDSKSARRGATVQRMQMKKRNPGQGK